jgi:hypothetical protein
MHAGNFMMRHCPRPLTCKMERILKKKELLGGLDEAAKSNCL